MKSWIVALIFVLSSLCATARAQVASASLLGEVHDETGAVAPDVTVSARHNETGFVRIAVTGTQGAYRLDELLPGAYTVTAEKPGFRTLTTGSLTLEVNQKARLDLVLKIGAQSDSVTVQASV